MRVGANDSVGTADVDGANVEVTVGIEVMVGDPDG